MPSGEETEMPERLNLKRPGSENQGLVVKDSRHLSDSASDDLEEVKTTGITYECSFSQKKLIHVHSKYLNEVIARVNKYTAQGRGSEEFTEYEPFPTLFYHMDDIRQEIAKLKNPDASLDLEALNLVAAEMEPFWRKAREENFESGFVSYDMLWRLFHPGEPVFHKDAIGSLWQFIFLRIDVEDSNILKPPSLKSMPPPPKPRRHASANRYMYSELIAWSLKWDNVEEQLTRKTVAFTVQEFPGQIPISSLPLSPLKHQEVPLGVDINESLARRGRQWWELIRRPTSCLDYHSAAFSHGESRTISAYGTFRAAEDGRSTANKLKMNGRIIIDFEAKGLWSIGYLGGVENELNVSEMDRREEYKWDKVPVTAKLTDEQARLCPANIGCCRLSDYKRFIVAIDNIAPVAWNISAMDHLVLEQKKKDMLKALVGQHYSRRYRNTQSDLIEGKGQSLVILLHGSPGVGKTLTAECVSEAVKKPLIALSIGDLVWEEKRLEQRLQEEFTRATDWDAILLLDEADVVLEARSFEDVRRNGIVSVFLRQLEYFQGVLFLTSNRVSTMDVAFQSRIQLGISFKAMTHDIRAQVWDKLLALNDRDKMIGSQGVQQVKEKLGKFQLNGRQIRNVLNVADGLAFSEYGEPGRLKYSHIREAVESAVEFQDMLEESKASMKSDQTVWAMYRGGSDEF